MILRSMCKYIKHNVQINILNTHLSFYFIYIWRLLTFVSVNVWQNTNFPKVLVWKDFYKIAHKTVFNWEIRRKSAVESKQNSCLKISQNFNFFSDQSWNISYIDWKYFISSKKYFGIQQKKMFRIVSGWNKTSLSLIRYIRSLLKIFWLFKWWISKQFSIALVAIIW